MSAVAENTRMSAGIRPPCSRITTSPDTKSAAGMWTVSPSRMTVAIEGTSWLNPARMRVACISW